MKCAASIRRRSAGFTLIEVLAAVAVLGILVVFMGRIFSESSKIWKLGNKRLESNNSGRAAIEYMSREISSAIVNNRLKLKAYSKVDQGYKVQNDRLVFVASSGTPQVVNDSANSRTFNSRQIKLAAFAVISTNGATGPFTLVEHNEFSPTLIQGAYKNPNWTDQFRTGNSINMDNSSVIADNVRSLKIFVYDQTGKEYYDTDYDSSPNAQGLPLFIDIYLEVLAEEDATKAALGATANIEKMTRRYQTRIALPNVQGYTRD